MSVKVSGLTKRYGTQIAVNDISFEVGTGNVIGFLGPNGAGKSTTMKMITGYLKPDEGTIEVCGLQHNNDLKQLKSKIGYLPEHNPLYLDMYITEILRFSAMAYGLKGQAINNRIKEVIELTGLTIESRKKAGALSKGYRQRLGLAMAILHDPEVLLLDEPTSGLDPLQLVEIRQLISDLGKQKTLIFSSHILQEVEKLCDRVIIINKGIIVADTLMGKSNQNIKVWATFAILPTTAIIYEAFGPRKTTIAGNRILIDTDNPKQTRELIVKFATDQALELTGLGEEAPTIEQLFAQIKTDN